MGKKHAAIKQVEQADMEVSRAIGDLRHAPPVAALGWMGKITDQPPLYAFIGGVAAAALIRRDARLLRTAARMFGAHSLGIQGKNLVKKTVDRTRPQMLIDEGRYESGKGGRDEKAFSSFPSGHTVGAVAIARALMRDYPERAAAGYAASATAAVARIAKCDHFVSDTAAGAAIGYAAEAIFSAVLDRLVPEAAG